MAEEWESESFTLKDPVVVAAANKWEGEDEEDDDDVKDSWDIEEEDKEEKKDVEKVDQKPKQKPKKALEEKIAQKERLQQLELEKKMTDQEKEEKEMSPEERLRRQKESDLQLALDTTFGDSEDSAIFGMHPTTKEEFMQLSDALNKKLSLYCKDVEFPAFAEEHIRNICATLSSFDIKRVKTTIDNMYLEKQKVEKGDKAKKNKGKGKARLRVEGDNTKDEYSAYADSYDYDDFM